MIVRNIFACVTAYEPVDSHVYLHPTGRRRAGMAGPTGEYLGIGAVAERVGVSCSAIRKWERIGAIPAAARLAGSDRRVYRLADLAEIQRRVTEMRENGRR